MATTIYYTIKGNITNHIDQSPLKGLNIKLYDSIGEEIKSTISDDLGAYQLTFTSSSVNLYSVKVFINDYLLKVQTNIIFKAEGEVKIIDFNLTMPFIIWGKVVNPDNTFVSNKIVKCYKKLFGGEELLYTATTNEDGEYYLYYENDNSNIIVNLYEDDSTDEPINTTGLKTTIAATKEINFLYNSDKLLGTPKVTELSSKLNESIDARADLSDLTREDVIVLSSQLDASEQDARLYIRAKQIFTDLKFDATTITSDIIFALIKNGLSTKTSSLFMQNAETYRRTLLKAVENNTLPNDYFDNADDLDSIIIELQKVAIVNAEKDTAEKFSLYDIFKRTGLDTKDTIKDEFLELYSLNEKADNDFWASLPVSTYSLENIAFLKFNIDIMNFTEYNIYVYNALQSYGYNRPIKTLKVIAENILDWTDITVNAVDFPDHIIGETLADKRINYAIYFKQKLEKQFPAETIKAIVKGSSLSPNAKSFIGIYSDFEFMTESVEDYFVKKEVSMETESSAFTELQKIQRLASLLPENNKQENLFILWDINKIDSVDVTINSAHDIIKIGKRNFLQQMIDAGASENDANIIWKNAKSRNAKSLAVYSKYSPQFNRLKTNVLNDVSIDANLSNLFKSFDSCTCQHPYSTLSPSAYLVDNLQFLKEAGTSPNVNLYEKLRERRPDIERIKLEENNSNTLMPYIDIVNEVLENSIANTLGTEEDYQTTVSEEDAVAYPQYQIDTVYETLSLENKPSGLPFNLAIEESRTWLKLEGCC